MGNSLKSELKLLNELFLAELYNAADDATHADSGSEQERYQLGVVKGIDIYIEIIKLRLGAENGS